jgi:hypothetical protein
MKAFSIVWFGIHAAGLPGREIVSHTGGVNGFVSSVTLVPEEKLGIIVLTNTDQNAFFEALKWEILDAYLSLPYRNYGEAYLKDFKEDMDANEKKEKTLNDSVALHLKTALPLNAYTGTYVNDVYGKMSVVMESGELRMKFFITPICMLVGIIGSQPVLCCFHRS